MVIRLKYNTYYLKKTAQKYVFFLIVICRADFFAEKPLFLQQTIAGQVHACNDERLAFPVFADP